MISWLEDNGVWAPLSTSDHVPFVMDPVRFSRHHYSQAVLLAGLFNRLIYQIVTSSRDSRFLERIVGSLGEIDPFCALLARILEGSSNDNSIVFNICRSDYLVDGEADWLLQVELNTIACSFVAQSAKISEMHR